ncbi:MAG: hypothetical protein ACXQTD_05905 [Candidatus Syntropharchaeia archaeon]
MTEKELKELTEKINEVQGAAIVIPFPLEENTKVTEERVLELLKVAAIIKEMTGIENVTVAPMDIFVSPFRRAIKDDRH